MIRKIQNEWLAPIAVVAIVAYVIFGAAVNFPVWDAWHMVSLFEKMYTSQLTLSDLYQSINGHRLLFPKGIMLAVGHLSQYDVRFELAINFFIASGIYILYWKMLNDKPLPKRLVILASILLPILTFSLVQYENWYFGWQICYWLCLLCSLSSMYVLTRDGLSFGAVVGSGLIAFVSSYSFAVGLLVWPVGAAIIAFKKQWSFVLVWLIGGLLCYTSYFWGDHSALLTDYAKSSTYILYFMVYLGTPLAVHSPMVAIAWSCLGLVLFALLMIFRGFYAANANMLFLVSCGIFSMLCGILISIARIGYGVEYAALSRYTCFSSMFWVALVALALKSVSDYKNTPSAMTLAIYFVLLMIVFSSVKSSLACLPEFDKHQRRVELAVREIKKEKRELMDIRYVRNITWDVEYTLSQVRTLKKYRLSIYAAGDDR